MFLGDAAAKLTPACAQFQNGAWHLVGTYLYDSPKQNIMFIKDQWSQRILAIAFGCSALLLSASALVASIKWVNPAQADVFDPQSAAPKGWDEGLRGAVGLGIKDNNGYFIIWSQPNQFYKVDLTKARDWYED
jgi:hypothetical protein